MTYTQHLIKNWKVAFHALHDFFAHFIHGLIPAIKIRHHQPEIIRCKDCKHSRFFDPCFYCYEMGGEIIVPENGFCFKAERREDG